MASHIMLVTTITSVVATIVFTMVTRQLSLSLSSALCSYPHVKVEIRDSSQISTTAPIFLQFNYFRQKYLEIASCSDSLLIYIWVRVDHSLLQQ